MAGMDEGRGRPPAALVAALVVAACIAACVLVLAAVRGAGDRTGIGAGGSPGTVAEGSDGWPTGEGTDDAADAGGAAAEVPALEPIPAHKGVGRVLDALVVPDACVSDGTLSSVAESGLGVRATWQVEMPLEEAAASVLEGYAGMSGLTLEHDGYIDLLGHVWSCVVSSEGGWSEVVLVDERDEVDDFSAGEAARACAVTNIHIGPSRSA